MSDTPCAAPFTRVTARWIVTAQHTLIERGAIDLRGDRILAVHQRAPKSLPAGCTLEALGEVALMPGLVNAHSHAFQRVLRGRTEWLHRDRPHEDFWSWREAMYAAANSCSADELEQLATRTFWEMALSGITCVGEFHYVHHAPDGQPYDDPDELAHRVVRAARRVGLRITLLRVAYHRGGYQRPLTGAQRRFVTPSLADYTARLDALTGHYAGASDVRVGAAPHSVRAVPRDWLTEIARWAADHDAPLHIHASEQRAELVQSLQEHGMTPVELLHDARALDARTTLVHATHLSQRELDLIGAHGAQVCACPTTERNLGDGFLPALGLLQRRVPISLGSDSHADIDLWEEARLVEYHERLRYERRNVLASAFEAWHPERVDEERREVAALLLPMLSAHGARTLGWSDAGGLGVGQLADFVALDLAHPSLLGVSAESALAHLALSVKTGAVRDVFVGGEAIVRQRAHLRLSPDALLGPLNP